MMDIYLDLTEAGHARGQALDVMNHLLAQCTQVVVVVVVVVFMLRKGTVTS